MVRTARFAFDDDRFDRPPAVRDSDAIEELPLPEHDPTPAATRRRKRASRRDLAGADWMQDERESA